MLLYYYIIRNLPTKRVDVVAFKSVVKLPVKQAATALNIDVLELSLNSVVDRLLPKT